MKKQTIYLLALVFALATGTTKAQTLNWGSLTEENKHLVNATIGIEHGMVYGIGYGYQVKNNLFPIVVSTELSIPSGNQPFDDFKAKVGGQIRWVKYRNFQFSTRVQGVYRSYTNDFVRLGNFGSDMAAVAGYYKPKWFAAGEAGFDKAIVTHFKHAQTYRDQFAGVKDGWYEPATGGNFYYGLQGGFSFKNQDITLRVGKMLTQDFKSAPLVPFYGQLGYTAKF